MVGTISVYEVGGAYQVYVKQITYDGIGDLYKSFEELKRKLDKEGLFDQKFKKTMPYLPNRVGIITSSTGSVIKDIINVSTRRYNNVNLLIYPAIVQGGNTAKTIIDGIDFFNKHTLVDVIIIARGGGSFEDLYGFNDEQLARTIFKSNIPIISAIGHETDFTICDFVADLRAPTPSAAAELVYPSSIEILNRIKTYKIRLNNSIKNNIENRKRHLALLTIDRLQKSPKDLISKYRIMNDNFVTNIEKNIKNKINESKLNYQKHIALLDSFSPLKTLSRGYSIVQDEKGYIINKKNRLKIGENLNITLTDGNIKTKIERII